MNTRAKGKKGEDLANNYLKSKGYRLIDKNFYCSAGEIDLIFEDNNVLVFVEVKSAKGTDFGQPEERINRTKIRRLTESANIYLAKKNIYDQDCRFDVISIIYNRDNTTTIKHIKNAFWGDESKS